MARAVMEHVLAAAAASPDVEVCGLLFGRADAIDHAAASANVAADACRFFEIDPAALIAAHRAERAGGPTLVGHYHSHPGGSPVPSATDAAAAEPGRLWLIVGGGAARLWRAERHGFREVGFVIGNGVA